MCICLSVSQPFQFLNQVTDFHESWYERHVSGSNLNIVLIFTVSNTTYKMQTKKSI